MMQATSLGAAASIRHAIGTPATPAKRLGTPSAVEIEFNIEAPVANTTVEFTKLIDTQFPQTAVKIRANLVGFRPIDQSSPQFLASRRRERCRRIAAAIAGLAKNSERDDFFIWTQRPLLEIKKLIHFFDEREQFAESEYEGNSCEVLRQLRDTFLSGGWEQYRKKSVRDAVSLILKHLSTADQVTAEFADETMDRLMDLDLNPVTSFSIQPIKEDGEEE